MVGACSKEVPEAVIVRMAKVWKRWSNSGRPQVGDFFVVQLLQQAKDWSVLVPVGVEQSTLDNGDGAFERSLQWAGSRFRGSSGTVELDGWFILARG